MTYWYHSTIIILPAPFYLAPLFVFLQSRPILLISYNLPLHTSACAAPLLSSYSDFVKSSYDESWYLSSVVKNHESQFKKQRVLN